jgi:hypothetical protein
MRIAQRPWRPHYPPISEAGQGHAPWCPRPRVHPHGCLCVDSIACAVLGWTGVNRPARGPGHPAAVGRGLHPAPGAHPVPQQGVYPNPGTPLPALPLHPGTLPYLG